MPTRVQRRTVDLSGFPDLVVVLLGMSVNRFTGLKMLFGTGPKLDASLEARPDGLLHHEFFFWSLFPLHAGIRQYWRDFDALEAWARSEPHRSWWRDFLRDSGGTGFWHETYFMRGGMEAVYDDMPEIGFQRFAPIVDARGAMFSSRLRARREGAETAPTAVPEGELYS